jgi:hypothetical protein
MPGTLKQMAEITTEDALACAKLFHDDYEWTVEENSEILILVKCRDYRIFIWKDEMDFMEFEELYPDKEVAEAHGCDSEPCSPYRSIIDIIDYLRSKGYNLPNKFSQS